VTPPAISASATPSACSGLHPDDGDDTGPATFTANVTSEATSVDGRGAGAAPAMDDGSPTVQAAMKKTPT
jgi:hypothetical protein